MKAQGKNKKNDTNDLKRYLGVLNEQHGENLKAIREGFSAIHVKLDSHAEMIGNLAEDVTDLKKDMTIVKYDISIIKSDLKKRVDYDEFTALTKRVALLESKRSMKR